MSRRPKTGFGRSKPRDRCKNGHVMKGENVEVLPDGRRRCVPCKDERYRRKNAARNAKRNSMRDVRETRFKKGPARVAGGWGWNPKAAESLRLIEKH